MTRDFGPLFERGQCLICGVQIPWVGEAGAGPYSPEGHAAPHLADGSACVQMDFRKVPPVEQVVPTDSLPVTDDDGSVWDATSGGDCERHDTNSENLRRALTELAATRRRIARAAKEQSR